jgi:hypothetical protein
VTALVKSNNTTTYEIKGGNAQSGALSTWYSGALPDLGGYTPMHLEGAIVLGTGGDDSNSSVGDFFEGVVTNGEPSDAADTAVQAEHRRGRLRVPEREHRRDQRRRRGQVPRRAEQLRHRGHPAGQLDLQRRRQPGVDAHHPGPADGLQRQRRRCASTATDRG